MLFFQHGLQDKNNNNKTEHYLNPNALNDNDFSVYACIQESD